MKRFTLVMVTGYCFHVHRMSGKTVEEALKNCIIKGYKNYPYIVLNGWPAWSKDANGMLASNNKLIVKWLREQQKISQR